MTEDRWWRGFDAVVCESLSAGSRVLDVGCGGGGLVRRLVEAGFDAVGVDPRAAASPCLVAKRVEEVNVGEVGRFDAVTAVMALHHVELERVLAALSRLLRRDGRVLVSEFAWERYDGRAAWWLESHDRAAADHSVGSWRREHGDLHTGETVRAALADAFSEEQSTPRPYLARMLDASELEGEEETLIGEGALPALGWWFFGRAR
jgi:SAM-dependent methyltransferase